MENLIDVLDNWVARGIRYDESGRPSMAHLGWIEHGGSQRLMRVAVSMDDQRITTAFADTPATNKWNSGDFDYFQRTYEQRRYEMQLKVHYDPDCDAIGANYGLPRGGTYELATVGMVMIDVPDEDSYEAIGLEVFAISAWLPLGKRGYCEETDTLTIGRGAETATIIAENGDLVAYWRPDEYDPGDTVPIAVSLRNASQHLAPVIEAMSQPFNVANR